MKIRNLRYWILIADLLWLLGSLQIAIQLRYAASGTASVTEPFLQYFLMILAAVLAWTLLYFAIHLDGFQCPLRAPHLRQNASSFGAPATAEGSKTDHRHAAVQRLGSSKTHRWMPKSRCADLCGSSMV